MSYGLQPVLGLESAPSIQQKKIPDQIAETFVELIEGRTGREDVFERVTVLLKTLTGINFKLMPGNGYSSVRTSISNNVSGYSPFAISRLDRKSTQSFAKMLVDYDAGASVIDLPFTANMNTFKFKGPFIDRRKYVITVGNTMLKEFDAKGITAVILHEVGHVVFELTTIGNYVGTSLILKELTNSLLFDEPSPEVIVDVKKIILERAKKENLSKEVAILSSDACTVTDILRVSMMVSGNHMATLTLPNKSTELRDEQFADYYVTWLGYGRHLAKYWKLMMRGNTKAQSTLMTSGIAIALYALIGSSGLATLPIALLAVYICGITEEPLIYDREKERFMKLIRGMRTDLRSLDVSDEEKREYLSTLDEYEKRASKMSEWDNYLSILMPFAVRNHNARRYEQRLEDFAQNPLLLSKLRLELS